MAFNGHHWDYFDERDRKIVAEHRRRVNFHINLLLRMREIMEPFAVSVTEFKKVYRNPQHLVLEICQIVAPYMPARYNRGGYSPLEIKVLCALGFYASGSYQNVVGKMADISVCQGSVSNAISQVTSALNHEDVMGRFIRFPLTHMEREYIIARNEQLGMPRVLGFIDCTLVKIVPPPRHMDMEVYYCRKSYTALNVQLTCDVDLYITSINARFPGSCNDPFIYKESGVRDVMQEAYRETRCWLLGDSIYPHEPWLHTPLPRAEPGTPEYYYTKLHCHCRNPIERCNGVLKERWRCCLHDRTLHYRPVKAGQIVNACAVLHNFCLLHNLENPRPEFPPEEEEENVDDVDDGDIDDDEDDNDNAAQDRRRLRQLAENERQFLIDYAYEHRHEQ